MKHIAKVLIFALMVSLLCVGGATAANDYEGVWEYDDYTTWFDFDADGTWREYFYEGLAVDGYYEVSGDTLDVYLWDGTVWYIMDVDDDVMTDDDGDTLFPSKLPDFEDSDLEDGGFTGTWEYTEDDESLWIQIYEAGRYMIYTESDGAYSVGEVRLLDDDTIGLYQSSDDSDDDVMLELTLKNNSLVDEEGGKLVRSELPYDSDSSTVDSDNREDREDREDQDELCEFCDGTGDCPNPDCFLGEIDCSSCGGLGTCSSCYGTGRWGENRCSRCDGTGTCTRCSGIGYFVCPICNGTMFCPYCDGTGLA